MSTKIRGETEGRGLWRHKIRTDQEVFLELDGVPGNVTGCSGEETDQSSRWSSVGVILLPQWSSVGVILVITVPGDEAIYYCVSAGLRLHLPLCGDPLHHHLRPLHHPAAGPGDGPHPLRH